MNESLWHPDLTPIQNKHLLSYIQKEYDKPKRYYHNFDHIAEMLILGLKIFDINKMQYMAIAFHDIVYDTTKTDNEEKSANVMLNWQLDNVDKLDEILTAREMAFAITIIGDTKGHFIASDYDSPIVLDLDLERLSRPYPEVDEYSKLIRLEYEHVDGNVFREGRRKFFEDLLSRGSIMQTDFGRKNWEPAIRRNAALSLLDL